MICGMKAKLYDLRAELIKTEWYSMTAFTLYIQVTIVLAVDHFEI